MAFLLFFPYPIQFCYAGNNCSSKGGLKKSTKVENKLKIKFYILVIKANMLYFLFRMYLREKTYCTMVIVWHATIENTEIEMSYCLP